MILLQEKTELQEELSDKQVPFNFHLSKCIELIPFVFSFSFVIIKQSSLTISLAQAELNCAIALTTELEVKNAEWLMDAYLIVRRTYYFYLQQDALAAANNDALLWRGKAESFEATIQAL